MKNIVYVGVNDHDIDLFEGQYEVPNGMAYNSYVILDEKVAVLDTVDARKGDEWLENVGNALGGRTPDYLIVHHMEPDHSSNIARFLALYPAAIVVASDKAFGMMKKFFGDDYADHRLAVKDGDKLALGAHTLTFYTAPMVHWPEVIVSYDDCTRTLFSADAFGKFGALDHDEDWACEARRYYFGIVGKFGMQVQKLLSKLAGVQIERICPLHGPVLTENLSYYLGLYTTWSSYGVESEGIVIAYTSVYGHTREAVMLLADELTKRGQKVSVTDLARDDMAEAVEDAFRYGKLVLATTTYNGDIFPFMRTFIEELLERNYQNRTVGVIENGSWNPMAAKRIRAMFEGEKNITFIENDVTVHSALNGESREAIASLSEALCGNS